MGEPQPRRDVARTGLAFLIGAALSALAAYLTGGGAEDAVERLPGVTEALIESHEEIALVAAIVVGALGAIALFGLWRYRGSVRLPRGLVVTLLFASVAGTGLMAYTGLLGGRIRHTEVRPGYVAPDGGLAGDAAHGEGE